MKNYKSILMLIAFGVTTITYSQKEYTVDNFDKIIISPHIEATLVQGDKEGVKVVSSSVDEEKINVELNRKKLRVYLEDAKEITKQEKLVVNGQEIKRTIYKGTELTILITYKKLSEVSFRGEEKLTFESALNGDEFELRIYGESEVYFNEVNLDEMETIIYGEALFQIKSGSIKEQKFTAYGESKIDVLGVENEVTKLTAYGEAQFEINASKKIKMTTYGEPKISYKGGAEISKGLNIGKATIRRIDEQ